MSSGSSLQAFCAEVRGRFARPILSPARRGEEIPQSPAPGLRLLQISPNGAPLVKCDYERIVALDVAGQAVLGAVALGLKGPEEAIPDDEDSPVIPV